MYSSQYCRPRGFSPFIAKEVAEDFLILREKALKHLTEESELEEIVRLVGVESLSPKEQLVLFISKLIREDFLYQSAFDPIDQYSSLKKQYSILKTILLFYELAEKSIEESIALEDLKKIEVLEKITRARFIEEMEFHIIEEEIKEQINNLRSKPHHG